MSTFKYEPFKDSRGGSLGGENFFMPEFLLKDGTCSFRDYEELVQLHSKIYIEKALSEFEKLKNKKIEKKARKAKKKELLTG